MKNGSSFRSWWGRCPRAHLMYTQAVNLQLWTNEQETNLGILNKTHRDIPGPKIRSTVFNHAVDAIGFLQIQKSHISKPLTLSSHDACRFCSCNLPSRKIPCLVSRAQKCRLWIIRTLNHPNPNLDHFKQKNKLSLLLLYYIVVHFFGEKRSALTWAIRWIPNNRGSKAAPCNWWHLGRPAAYQVVLWKWLIHDRSW